MAELAGQPGRPRNGLQAPRLARLERRDARPVISRVLAVPEHRPLHVRGRCQQGLGVGHRVEIASQVDQDQSDVRALAQIAQDECLWPEHGAVDEFGALQAEDRIFAAESEQILEEQERRIARDNPPDPRAWISRKAVARHRIREEGSKIGMGRAAEAGELLASSLRGRGSARWTRLIAEVEEGPAAAELLSLEEHGSLGRQQPERGHRPVTPGLVRFTRRSPRAELAT